MTNIDTASLTLDLMNAAGALSKAYFEVDETADAHLTLMTTIAESKEFVAASSDRILKGAWSMANDILDLIDDLS